MLEALKRLFGKKPVVVVEPPKPVAKKAPVKKAAPAPAAKATTSKKTK